MAGQKREKDMSRNKKLRQEQRRLEKQRRQRRNAYVAGGVVAGLAIVGIAFALWPESSAPSATEASPAATRTPVPPPVPTPAGVNCTEAQVRTQDATYTKATAQNLTTPSTWVLNTNCGEIEISLAVKAAPVTTNTIAYLTNSGWYTENACPRVTTQGLYVLQCGARDPNGFGDSGLKLPVENAPKANLQAGYATYSAGSVAMAASSQGISGSQFFIVYKDTPLPAEYSIFGQVTKGLDVVKYVAANGVSDQSPNPTDGPPATPIAIETASIRNGS